MTNFFNINSSRISYRLVLLLIPLLFLAVFYFYPVFKILLVSFSYNSHSGSDTLISVLTKGSYLRVIWFTFYQALLSTLITVILALPCTYVFVTYRFPGKNILKAFITIPFVMPTVVVASAFQSLLGSQGLLNTLLTHITGGWIQIPDLNYTLFIIISAHVFFNFSVCFRIIGGFWNDMGISLQEAARVLGASPVKTFFHITLPVIMPAVFASSLLVFIFCFSSFGVIIMLGGPMFSTIETEIYRQTMHLFNLPVAAVLSMFQIGFTFILMWGYTRISNNVTLKLDKNLNTTSRKPKLAGERLLVWITVACTSVSIILPLLSLVYKSFQSDTGFTLVYYTSLFTSRVESIFYAAPQSAIFNSLASASVTLVLSVILGISASLFLAGSQGITEKLLDPVFMLPLSTSAVTLGFGFIIALDSPPLNLRSSPVLVPIAHSLVAFPFVVRAVLPALRSIPSSLKEASFILGASETASWKHIDLPVISRAVVVGAVFAFSISLGEFGATSFVARPETPTIPLAIYRYLGRPGALNYGQAMAMSSILMVVTSVCFITIERFGKTGRNIVHHD